MTPWIARIHATNPPPPPKPADSADFTDFVDFACGVYMFTFLSQIFFWISPLSFNSPTPQHIVLGLGFCLFPFVLKIT